MVGTGASIGTFIRLRINISVQQRAVHAIYRSGALNSHVVPAAHSRSDVTVRSIGALDRTRRFARGEEKMRCTGTFTNEASPLACRAVIMPVCRFPRLPPQRSEETGSCCSRAFTPPPPPFPRERCCWLVARFSHAALSLCFWRRCGFVIRVFRCARSRKRSRS